MTLGTKILAHNFYPGHNFLRIFAGKKSKVRKDFIYTMTVVKFKVIYLPNNRLFPVTSKSRSSLEPTVQNQLCKTVKAATSMEIISLLSEGRR